MNKQNIRVTLLLTILLILESCMILNLFNSDLPFVDYFDNDEYFTTHWKNNSREHPSSYGLNNGKLKISTRANSKDRVKTKTKRKNFGLGTYEWVIYIPKFKLHQQCSIGAFIYHSGKTPYELDFEIGSGKKELRKSLKAKNNEAVVYCSSQFSPDNSSKFTIPMEQWASFKMELSNQNNFYTVKWFINNQLVKTLPTKIKCSIRFSVHNSLENLHFMGDEIPSTDNYTLFDSFQYTPLTSQ